MLNGTTVALGNAAMLTDLGIDPAVLAEKTEALRGA